MNLENENLKNVFSGVIGNAFEWYDFALFGAFASTLSQLFFPESTSQVAMLKIYGIFAAGFIMRPLGSLVLGYIGDKKGRKTTLLLSILLMAIPTICIGMLPAYYQIGALAPYFLILTRLIQGFAMGGEYGSSMVFLFEHAPQKQKGFYSSWVDVGCLVGVLLGTLAGWGTNTFLNQSSYLSWGWRLPFIASIGLAILALYFRHNLEETNTFKEFVSESSSAFSFKKFNSYIIPVISVVFVYAFGNVCFYIFLVFIPNYFIQEHTVSSGTSLLVTSAMSALIAIVIPFGGYLSDKYGRQKLLSVSIIVASLLTYPLFLTMSLSHLQLNLLSQIFFALALGTFYGGEAAFFAQTFPPQVRCRGVSLVLSFSNIFFGGISPLLATWIVQEFREIKFVGLMITFVGLLALWGLLKTSPQKLDKWSLKYN